MRKLADLLLFLWFAYAAIILGAGIVLALEAFLRWAGV